MADETDGNSQASDAATELQLSLSSKRVSKAGTTFAALTEVEDSDVEQEAATESQQSSDEKADDSKAEVTEDFHQQNKAILQVLFGQYQPLERTETTEDADGEEISDNLHYFCMVTDAAMHFSQRLLCLGDERFIEGTDSAENTSIDILMGEEGKILTNISSILQHKKTQAGTDAKKQRTLIHNGPRGFSAA